MTMKIKPRKNGADPTKLTVAQQRFILEFLANGMTNAADAVRLAYPKIKNPAQYSTKLLNHPKVKAILGKTMREDAERLELDRLEVLRQLWYALTRKARDFVGEDGIPLTPDRLPEECQSIVDGYRVKVLKKWREDEGETHCELVSVEYKLTPHAVAREQAMKHKGLFEPEKHDVRVMVFDFDRLAAGGEESVNVIEAEIVKALPAPKNGKPKKGASDGKA